MGTGPSPPVRDDGWGFVDVETGAAIGEYNRLVAAGRRVAALLHSTC